MTKFFTNETSNTLFQKFQGLAKHSKAFEIFDAVTGFFRASGYFKLRRELVHVSHIRVLIGMELDNFFAKHDKSKFFEVTPEKVSKKFREDFIEDIRKARYAQEVEEGIIQLFDDVQSGRVELRVHPSRNLHAKFYLCLPKEFNENSGGTVIMGSSNLTDSGLGMTRAPRYELNVEIRDYEDVKFCKDEFEKLWKDGIPLNATDLEKAKTKTYLGVQPTPYELYMKVLIDTFGDIAEDRFEFTLPNGIMDLRYQRDAAVQGFQMLMRHHGFYLADVVGLGKTLVALMVVQRFVFENGATSKILVVTPPAAEAQWKDMIARFKMERRVSIVKNGSLSDILDKDPNAYDLVIVDEAHGFRKTDSQKFQKLQLLCKSKRSNLGRLNASDDKYVMLLSATPLNNYPNDLRNQIMLFQDTRRTTFDNIPDLAEFFSPLEKRFQEIRKGDYLKDEAKREIEKVYAKIRNELLSQIMVRRTRTNIQNDKGYREDLANQGVVFPRLSDPQTHDYLLDGASSALFAKTVHELSENIHYARYRAVEYLIEATDKQRQTASALESLFRIHMVKRLESSIPAFRKSLDALIKYTKQMLDMFGLDKIIIAPEYDVKNIIERFDGDIDAALLYLAETYPEFKPEEHTYSAKDFKPELHANLIEDYHTLGALAREWDELCKHVEDPKLDVFRRLLTKEHLFNSKLNPSGKLVVFSESSETANYLCEQIGKISRFKGRCLVVEAKTFKDRRPLIQANFDANFVGENNGRALTRIDILFTTDALAEGINLHRANVIVHYDTPWNATRLMQRIGRVNRIGSTCSEIHNVVFYPSKDGEEQIRLCQNAFVKISAFHAALGEDARIFSTEEMLHEMELYSKPEMDDTDKRLALLREVQDFYKKSSDHYRRIRNFPDKVRTFRDACHASRGTRTLVFLRAEQRVDYYSVSEDSHLHPLTFTDAAEAFRAEVTENPIGFTNKQFALHMKDVESARLNHQEAVTRVERKAIVLSGRQKQSSQYNKAIKTLRIFAQRFPETGAENVYHQIAALRTLVDSGSLASLEITLAKLCPTDRKPLQMDAEEIRHLVAKLYEQYRSVLKAPAMAETPAVTPPMEGAIIVSESFA